jgi:hypothetical protein
MVAPNDAASVGVREAAARGFNHDQCFSLTGETVASRNEMIVQIISPFAFTFKIPFH